MPRSGSPRRPPDPPANAEEGAEAIRLFVLERFHRPDGEAADWELIAGSLCKAALYALDKMPEDRRRAFIERLQVRFYERIHAAEKVDTAPSNSLPDRARSEPSNIAGPKSKGPPPPR